MSSSPKNSDRFDIAAGFETRDSPEDHSQHVKQHVSRFLEDLLGESLDLVSPRLRPLVMPCPVERKIKLSLCAASYFSNDL